MAVALLSSTLAVATDGPSSGLVRAGNRLPEVVAFDRAMVGFSLEAANLLGIPNSIAAIYGICFASAEPLGFADIEERLDISKGSISQGVRILRSAGALKSVRKPDDRREAFEPDLRLRKLIERWLAERLQKQLNAGQWRLQQIARTIPGGRSASAKILRDRLKSLQNWHDKTRDVLPIIKAFLKLT